MGKHHHRHLTLTWPARIVSWVGLVIVVVGVVVWWPGRTPEPWNDAELQQLVATTSAAWELDPSLVTAVIACESSGNPAARSSKGAVGLMQILSIAEREVHRVYPHLPRGDLLDPDYNVLIGCAYLHLQLQRFEGDVVLALAAYNAGPTRIARLRRQHPQLSSAELIDTHAPAETQQYWRRVMRHWQAAQATTASQ